MATPADTEFTAGTLSLRDRGEFEQLLQLREGAFTAWYRRANRWRSGWPRRLRENALAACFPEFAIEMRTARGEVAGWLFGVPAAWDGNPDELPALDAVRHAFEFGRGESLLLVAVYFVTVGILRSPALLRGVMAPARRRRLDGRNAIVLVALLIREEFKGRHLPAKFLDAIRARARELGCTHIVGAFRPSEYGAHKLARRLGFDARDFAAYCSTVRADGKPADAWLRSLAANGIRFANPVAHSLAVTRPAAAFSRFRRTHKAELWYEAAPGNWECGETQSWFVDAAAGTVTSVEPNLWGVVPWKPIAELG